MIVYNSAARKVGSYKAAVVYISSSSDFPLNIRKPTGEKTFELLTVELI